MFFISILISFLLNINLSNIFGPFISNEELLEFNINAKNGGAVSDLTSHWRYINLLKKDLSNLISSQLGVDTYAKLINFPLHHIIFSQLSFLKDINHYLLFFFIFSLFVPIIFYKSLKIHFSNDKLLLIFLSSLIYLFPAFQYSAIWGNNHITALFFFCVGIYFYNEFKYKNKKKFFNLYSAITFFSLTCYTKQFYVFFFIFLIFDLLKYLKFKDYLILSIFTFTLTVPGIIFTYKNPLLFFGLTQKTTNFTSSIIVSGSIIFFYLAPFIIQYFLNLEKDIKSRICSLIDKKIIIISLIISIIGIYLFEYNSHIGGGIFYKFSLIKLDNLAFFFLTSFLGTYFIFFFSKKELANLILTILLLITFSSGYFIFQKYFEPMFYIIFLNFFDKNKIINSIKDKNYIIIIYFSIYYLILNYTYFSGL